MASEKNNNDLINENEIFGEKKTVTLGKNTPKDIVMNILSAVLFFLVALFSNLFLDGEFHYEQIFTWNLGLLVIVNWVCGTMITYCTRQSGISAGKQTKEYKAAEIEKDKAFEKITDYSVAQKRLNEKIEEDFDARRNTLETAIAKLVRHAMPDGKEWKIGDKLPKRTHFKVKLLKRRLERMTPNMVSLTALAQSEAHFTFKGLYDVPDAPDKTGVKWFAAKGGGKILWFAVAPMVLSIVAGGLTGGVTFGSIMTVIGTLAIMIFNAVRSYFTAFHAITKKGVERFRQIVKIVNSIT